MVSHRHARRGEVYLVQLDPTRGSEIQKTRPCVVVSPDELNLHLATLIVAPLTSGGKPYPFRVPCHFADRDGQIVLDQLRAVDRERLTRRIGRIDPDTLTRILLLLGEMFTP